MISVSIFHYPLRMSHILPQYSVFFTTFCVSCSNSLNGDQKEQGGKPGQYLILVTGTHDTNLCVETHSKTVKILCYISYLSKIIK